jgi:S1-C subfamily serine protease
MTMLTAFSKRLRERALRIAAAAALALPATVPAQAAEPAVAPDPLLAQTGSDDKLTAAQKLDAARLFGAIVKVSTRSTPDARSADTLGSEREGTGVVIGDDGLVLTIGYLIVEADDVKVTDSKGRTLPARIVGYDHASGFGLVRTAVPLDAQPIALGDSAKTEERDPVMIASAGGDGTSFAWIVSKRPFTGNWEYRLDYALYTSPPTSNWSGAALIDRDGKLLGIGSLIVREATGDDSNLPGNVFVPIDLLKPILADLIREGHRAGPARPWLGVSADEMQGRLFVTRVSPDGPADRAGLSVGDIILGVGAEPVHTQAQFYERVWNRRHAGDEVPLKVLQGVDVKEIKVRSIDRVEYFRPHSTI